MTANIDVSELLTFCHTNGYKFYPTLIYCVTKVLNRIENFRMFKDKNGDLCVWDSLVPNYTIKIIHFRIVGPILRMILILSTKILLLIWN